ncbi:PIN domain nuclease [Klenkia sp. PcliD-1-E]|uniref:type II toxin-antitoxin system VapC family toxin n=1 Tax=Klenkia sp. PcliD-1-E TaxID=2954492 RepID=UPI00209826D4|nr:PIN domain nuclease [Klenkia sp. PcliD-1-E]MCO7218217.1 PIN domain nuclease [Klenkia sp. PcliD-1-E]
MILLDSSAWIAYLRDRPRPVADDVQRLLDDRFLEVHLCEPVVMELLAGARGGELARVDRIVGGLPVAGLRATLDFRAAAGLYQAARSEGATVRSLVDCLIAAVAIRHGAQVVHRDRDFDVLARVSPLDQRRLG